MKFEPGKTLLHAACSARKFPAAEKGNPPMDDVFETAFLPSKFTDLTKFHKRFFKKPRTSMNSIAKTVGSGARVDHESVYEHYAGQHVAEESDCLRMNCFDQNRRRVSICNEFDVQSVDSVDSLILVLHPLIQTIYIYIYTYKDRTYKPEYISVYILPDPTCGILLISSHPGMQR